MHLLICFKHIFLNFFVEYRIIKQCTCTPNFNTTHNGYRWLYFLYFRILLIVIGIALCIGTAYDLLHIRMKLFTSQELCSIAEQEELRVNEADRNGTIANGTTNGAMGTCNGTNGACNGEIGVNGATPVTNGSLTGHENANFEKNKLEIQVESESDSTKKVTDKETTSRLN